MAFLKKYNTYVFITLVITLAVADMILWKRLSVVRRLATGFALLAALHEVEEKIWPGGFYELMLKKFGLESEQVDLGRGTLVVSIFWVILLGAAYIFDSHPFLLAVTIVLSFFEAFIHTAGIWIHRLKKPYTPGLVTAWCMAAFAVITVLALKNTGLTAARDYCLGAVLWLLSFACMDFIIISGFGKTPREIIAAVTKQKTR